MTKLGNNARLLFFCRSSAPTKDEQADIRKQMHKGFDVHIRNAIYATTDGALEPADAIAGASAPKAYQAAYPWADDFDPETVPAVGDEWVDDEGVAWVRAVRGDGVAYNMLLSLAAPSAAGSGAPSHGVYAGIDHSARIIAKDMGASDAEGLGAGVAGNMAGEASESPGATQTPPPAARKPVARRKPDWKRNA